MKKILFLFVFVAFLTPQLGFAEEGSQNPSTDGPRISGTNKDQKNEFKLKRDQLEATIAMHREEFKDAIKSKREAMKETFQARKDAFQDKLKTLTDEKKKTITERVDAKLTSINKKRTDRMSENLSKLEQILTKLKTKRDAFIASGKDVSTVNNAILAAETAIANAKSAVTIQAGKDYTPQITDETTLRQTVGTVMSQLEADLKLAHKAVSDAKDAVKSVAKALETLGGQNVSPTVTTSVEPSPTII